LPELPITGVNDAALIAFALGAPLVLLGTYLRFRRRPARERARRREQ
jgi:hypothetical protein